MTTTVEQNYARQQTASFRCVVLISSATLHCVQFAICLGGMTQSPGQQSVPFTARKPTRVSSIYRTETTTKKCKTEKKLESKNGYAQK